MKIYCINLARSADRRAFQLAQAKRLGLDIEFVDAVDFKSLSENDLIEAAQCWTRPIVGKDVGCFRSHKKAWEMVARGSQPAMIIEDDIVFSSTLPKVLQAIEEQAFPENRVYDLEYAPRKHVVAKRPLWTDNNRVNATVIYINKVGAGCYLLKPVAAKRLLTEVNAYAMVDSWLWTRPWIEQVQIEPCPSLQLRDWEQALGKLSEVSLATGTFKEYEQQSWIRKKTIRLLLTVDQLKAFIRALFNGQQRYLKIRTSDFI